MNFKKVFLLVVVFFTACFVGCSKKTVPDDHEEEIVSGEQRLLVAVEQASRQIQIINANTGNVEWKWSHFMETIPEERKVWFTNPSDVKPVYNQKYFLMTASGGAVALINIEKKKMEFYGYAGQNPHSAELLPDGNIITASSTDRKYSLFVPDFKAGFSEAYKTYSGCSPHNVVWDRSRNKLYMADCKEIIAYDYNNEKNNPCLLNKKVIGRVEEGGCHDMFPVYKEDKLWITTNHHVWQFDLEKGQLEQFEAKSPKSVSDGPEGYPVMYMIPTESWWADRLIDIDGDIIYQRDNTKFYKARWMLENSFSYPDEHLLIK